MLETIIFIIICYAGLAIIIWVFVWLALAYIHLESTFKYLTKLILNYLNKLIKHIKQNINKKIINLLK
jgi:hypothetical protein